MIKSYFCPPAHCGLKYVKTALKFPRIHLLAAYLNVMFVTAITALLLSELANTV